MIQVEIWSDVVCPFCYIGKRHLEAALAEFEHRDQVRILWKSFELDPNADRSGRIGVHEMLAKKYGQSLDWAKRMTGEVAQRAAAAGLQFYFDRAILTNSFDAHRLIHLAAEHGLQGEAQERFFAAHFMEGRDIGDPKVLLQLGIEIGLDPVEVQKVLAGNDCGSDVRRDEEEAYSLGVRGVPFFLFNRKGLVSGAQPVEVFLQSLRNAWNDRRSY